MIDAARASRARSRELSTIAAGVIDGANATCAASLVLFARASHGCGRADALLQYAMRKIADVTGTAGSATSRTIREIDAQTIPGARAPRCLVFENHTVVRRLWDVPASWRSLSVAALFCLAEEAS